MMAMQLLRFQDVPSGSALAHIRVVRCRTTRVLIVGSYKLTNAILLRARPAVLYPICGQGNLASKSSTLPAAARNSSPSGEHWHRRRARRRRARHLDRRARRTLTIPSSPLFIRGFISSHRLVAKAGPHLFSTFWRTIPASAGKHGSTPTSIAVDGPAMYTSPDTRASQASGHRGCLRHWKPDECIFVVTSCLRVYRQNFAGWFKLVYATLSAGIRCLVRPALASVTQPTTANTLAVDTGGPSLSPERHGVQLPRDSAAFQTPATSRRDHERIHAHLCRRIEVDLVDLSCERFGRSAKHLRNVHHS